jgi:hypothetical protein
MKDHKTLSEINNLPAGSYKVGVYSSFGCVACEGYVEKETDNVDYFVDIAQEDPATFSTYSFMPPVIPSIISIDK